jgi:hypothetical protein
MTTITLNNRRITAFRFHRLELALRTAGRKQGLAVVMGDCPEYWLVSMADAQRLETAGYELVTQSVVAR